MPRRSVAGVRRGSCPIRAGVAPPAPTTEPGLGAMGRAAGGRVVVSGSRVCHGDPMHLCGERPGTRWVLASVSGGWGKR
ncbi:hypothetical protein ACQCX1_07790 [Propionibacteriaceae bacterium Y2014]